MEADPSLSTKPYRSQLDRLQKHAKTVQVQSDIKLKSKSSGWFEKTV
jgi:hypothetical protein